MASHVEILQPRKRRRDASAEDARGWQPAFVTALPVAGIADKSGGSRDIGTFEVLSQARKPVIEDTDDFPNDRPLPGPVMLAIVLPKMGPELAAGGQPDRHDGFAFRAESRIGTEHFDFYPVMPRLVVHEQRLEKRQTKRVWGIREDFVDPQ